MFPRYDLTFCACTRAWLAPELLVSMGSSLHLWFLHAKQRLLDPNNESLWVPDLTCRFVHAKQRDLHQNDKPICVPAFICCFCMQNSAFWTSITSLHGSQTSSVVLRTHNSVLSTRIKRLYGFQPSSVFCVFKAETLGPKLHVSMDPRPHLWLFTCKTAFLASELLVSNGSQTSCVVFGCKRETYGLE